MKRLVLFTFFSTSPLVVAIMSSVLRPSDDGETNSADLDDIEGETAQVRFIYINSIRTGQRTTAIAFFIDGQTAMRAAGRVGSGHSLPGRQGRGPDAACFAHSKRRIRPRVLDRPGQGSHDAVHGWL